MAQIVSYSEAVAELRRWLDARAAIAAGVSYSLGGRTLTRQDSETIEGNIRRWHNTVAALEAEAQGKARPLGSRPAFAQPGSGGRGGIISQSLWEDGRT